MVIFSSSQQSKVINVRLKLKYQRLLDEAAYLPPVCDTFDPTKPPEWYDKDKLAQSQQVCMKYFYSLFTSVLIGAFLDFQNPGFVEPVITTGNHANISKIYRRYLATALHMRKWFLEDPFDRESSAYRSFCQVRSMHIKLCLSMNNQMNRKIGVDKLYSSLHDVIMTMFPFIGLLINHTTACGAHGMTADEKDKIIYAWRVISYAIGIDDRFNICDGSAEDFSELYSHYEVDFLIPLLSRAPDVTPLGWKLSQGYLTALKLLNFTLNFHSIVHYWFKCIGVPVKVKLNPLEWLILQMNNFIHYYLLQFRLIYNWLNNFLLEEIDKHKQIRNEIAHQLGQRYSHVNYKSSCPLNQDPDYRDDLAD